MVPQNALKWENSDKLDKNQKKNHKKKCFFIFLEPKTFLITHIRCIPDMNVKKNCGPN